MSTLPPALRSRLGEGGRGLAILVVRLGAMGDVIRTLPAVRLLRRSLPEASIAWAVERPWQFVLEGEPAIDRLLAIDRPSWRRRLRRPAAWPEPAREFAALRRALGATRAGLALDFHGNLRSGLVARLSGAPVRLGYAGHQQKEGNRWLTTHRVPPGDRRTPRLERNLDLVRALGLPDAPLPVGPLALAARGERDATSAREALGLPAGRPFAIVAPGASRRQAYKRPPPALLGAACDALASRGIAPIVVWGPGEEPDAREVGRASRSALLAPPTDLAALAALVRDARLFVGGDTGPMHLACVQGRPVVAIYGPTDPRVNGPWGGGPSRSIHPPGRRYTGVKRIDRRQGFEGLAGGAVAAAIGGLLDETAPQTPRVDQPRA